MADKDNVNDDETVGNEFDPDHHKEVEQKKADLKKQNIKNVFGSGTGRLALVVVGLCMLGLVIIGAVNLFRKPPTMQTADPGANAVLSAPSTGDNVATSEAEAEMRRKTNNAQAEQAQSEGKSYMPPPVLKADEYSDDLKVKTQQTQQQQQQQQQAPIVTNQQPQQNSVDTQQLAELKALREKIKNDEVQRQVFRAMGRSDRGDVLPTFSTSYYDTPNRNPTSNNGNAQIASVNTGAAQTAAQSGSTINRGKPLIQAGEGFYCELDNPINTDSARNDVIASCYQGVVENARAICKWERSPESATDANVTVICNVLAIPGKPSLAIQAVAFDESTNLSGLADDVDNHTMTRYGGLFVASVLRGLGTAASMVTGSTTVQSNGGVAVVQTQTDPMNTSRQIKIAAGEVGKTFADTLQRRSDMIKPTVKVGGVYAKGQKKGVRLVFLADVYEEKK